MTHSRIELAALGPVFAGTAFAVAEGLERVHERQRIVVGGEMKFPTVNVEANPDIEYIRSEAPQATDLAFEDSKRALVALKAGRDDVLTRVLTHLYRAASSDPYCAQD